jgi:hypothetical protein
VREIRTLRAMWRALETGLRQLLNGHEEGNLGYKPRRSLRAAAPVLDPTRCLIATKPDGCLKLSSVQVVVTDITLTHGDWRRVIEIAVQRVRDHRSSCFFTPW